MIEGDDLIEDDGEIPEFEDKIASRAIAYTRLLLVVSKIKDPALKREGVLMLTALRRSFKARSDADVTAIHGGKVEE